MADVSPLSATPPRPPRPHSASSFRELRDALRASPHVARLAHDGEAATAGVLVLALGAGLCLGLVLPADIEGKVVTWTHVRLRRPRAPRTRCRVSCGHTRID